MRVSHSQSQPLNSDVQDIEHSTQTTALSPRAQKIDGQLNDLIQRHALSRTTGAPINEGTELFDEIKNMLVSTLWLLAHVSSVPPMKFPVPSCPCQSLNQSPAQLIMRCMNSLSFKTRLIDENMLRTSLSKMMHQSDRGDAALELMAHRSHTELPPSTQRLQFQQLPTPARQIILNNIALRGSLRHEGELRGLTIRQEGCRDFTFRGVDLSGATLIGPFGNDFSQTNLDNARLKDFTLLPAGILSPVSMEGTDFGRNIRLFNDRCQDFHSCDLRNIHIDFQHATASIVYADLYLDHISNGSSLLTKFRDWPTNTPESAASRTSLMQRLATALTHVPKGDYSAVSEHHIAEAIADVVFRDRDFSRDRHPDMVALRQKVTQTLLQDPESWNRHLFAPGTRLDSPHILQTCAQSAIDLMPPVHDTPATGQVVNIGSLLSRSLSRKSMSQLPDSGLNHLLAAGSRHTHAADYEAGSSSQQLNAMLQHLREQQWRRLPVEVVRLLDDQGIDSSVRDFYVEQNAPKFSCVAYHQDYMDSMLNIMRDRSPFAGFDWKNAYLFRCQSGQPWGGPFSVGQSHAGPDPIDKDLSEFSLGACYQQSLANKQIAQVVRLFDLAAPPDNPAASEFSILFDKLRSHTSFSALFGEMSAESDRIVEAQRSRWLSPAKGNELADVFGANMRPRQRYPDATPFTPGQMKLTEPHLKVLNAALDGVCANDKATRARWFFALATTYTQLSSSTFMGTEVDSPLALRTYAAALMRHAHTLDANVFKNRAGADNFNDWHAQLCGEDGAFTCTSVLSYQMKAQTTTRAADLELSKSMRTIYPVHWP